MTDDDGDDPIAALEGHPPGREREDPYADTDPAALPGWWRQAIDEYEAHGLRAYRPPRFEDGVQKRDVVDRLEAELDVSIRLACFDPPAAPWQVLVDGEPVATVERRRSVEGYSLYEVTSEAFARLVREAAAGGSDDGSADSG